MPPLLRKSAPPLGMAALVIWCGWAQLSDKKPLLTRLEEGKLTRIERQMLHPEISDMGQRDPFLQPAVEQVAAAGPTQLQQPTGPAFNPATLLPTFRLDATVVAPDRRFALINGKLYHEGEAIKLADHPAVEIYVQRVLADGVVLQINDEAHEVHYSHTASQQAQRNARQAQPGSAPAAAASPAGLPPNVAPAAVLELLSAATSEADLEAGAELLTIEQGPAPPAELEGATEDDPPAAQDDVPPSAPPADDLE